MDHTNSVALSGLLSKNWGLRKEGILEERPCCNLPKISEIANFGAAAPKFRRYLEGVEKVANLVD